MKKSVCLMAILGAFASTGAMAAANANDQNIDVLFNASVIEANCKVTLEDGTKTLELGTIDKNTLAQSGARSALVPVVFKVAGCNSSAKAIKNITLEDDLTGQYPGNTKLNESTLSTTSEGLNLQFYNGIDGGTKGLANVAGKPINGTGDTLITVAYAAFVPNAKHATVQKGRVSSRAMFEVTFN